MPYDEPAHGTYSVPTIPAGMMSTEVAIEAYPHAPSVVQFQASSAGQYGIQPWNSLVLRSAVPGTIMTIFDTSGMVVEMSWFS